LFGDDVALQWRKSAKKGFSGECCPSATPVPAGFQQSGRGKWAKMPAVIVVKLNYSNLLNLGLW
jgi:hypothetical protein